MAKGESKTFEGLIAYNHVVKQVSKELKSKEITLKKGKYFAPASECSFRDIVNRSWLKAKGKSKKQSTKITAQVVKECLESGGYLKKAPEKLPELGESIAENVHYWELGNYIQKVIPDGSKFEINNEAYGGISDFEGESDDFDKDLLSEIYSELNALSNIRKWDSSSAPTYKFFYDKKSNKFRIILEDNEGRDEGIDERTRNWKDKQKEDFKELQGKDLEELTGGKQKIEKDSFITQQDRNKARIEVLNEKKKSFFADMKEFKELGMDDEVDELKAEIKKINNEIKKL